MVNRIASLRVLLIVTSRPEFDAPWVGQSRVRTLALNRPGHRKVGTVIDCVVGNKLLPANIKDIVSRTDGIAVQWRTAPTEGEHMSHHWITTVA